jgi:maltodextrin utilization protein YvdJ
MIELTLSLSSCQRPHGFLCLTHFVSFNWYGHNITLQTVSFTLLFSSFFFISSYLIIIIMSKWITITMYYTMSLHVGSHSVLLK